MSDDARHRPTAGHILTTQVLEGYRQEASYNAIPAGARFGYDGQDPPRGFLWCRGTFDPAIFPRLAVLYPTGHLPERPGEIIKF